jgi:hypothetical protein
MTKEQISKIISIIVMAAIALLAVFGYDVGIVQPEFGAIRGQPQAAGSQAVLGPYYESLNVGKDFKSLGTAEMAQATITSATITTATIGTVISSTSAVTTGALLVSGPATVGSLATAGDVSARNITGTGTLAVTGATALSGGLTMDTDKFTVADTTGQVIISPVADADLGSYDNWLAIESYLVGRGTKDRVYGLDIELTRPAGYGTTNGDHDDAGIKVRMTNKAVTNTFGTVLRGMDVIVKNDNPDGEITELSGATFTAKTDDGAGNTNVAVAMKAEVSADDQVTDTLIVGDFREFRQAATEPTTEGVLRVRNSSTTGTGADWGIQITSDYSATLPTDDFDYAIDMNSADVTIADVRLSNGNVVAATEGQVVYNVRRELTAAAIHTGATVITVPAGLQFRLVSASAIATVATCTTSTSIDLIANTTHLVAFTVSELVRSLVIKDGATGGVVLADGASYTAQTAGQDITIADVTGTTGGCTSVIFNISYTLQ